MSIKKEVVETKKLWESKTLWLNAILAAVAFFPKLADTVNEEMLLQLVLVVNFVLRLITKDKVSLSQWPGQLQRQQH